MLHSCDTQQGIKPNERETVKICNKKIIKTESRKTKLCGKFSVQLCECIELKLPVVKCACSSRRMIL